MLKRYLPGLLLALLLPAFSFSQYTNRGTDFWVPFPANQLATNAKMKVYISTLSTAANAVVETGTFVRTYAIAPNTTVASENIPITAQTTTEGLHLAKAIHVSSDVPVAVYVHFYGSASSGSTMLLPSPALGSEHRVLNITQNYGANSFSFFSVVAIRDSTDVEINPAQNTQNGWTPNGGSQPNGSYLVHLKKGDVYQVLASSQTADLTGSIVKSVANDVGKVNAVAVFGGSTRTSLISTSCTSSGGDFIIGQVFPIQLWSTKFATAPFSNSIIASGLTTSVFRVMVKDPTTVVKRNGVTLTNLFASGYYQFESNTADVITSDKPVLVAQYMTGACTGLGDPEMIYISPLSEAIARTGFYRTSLESISANYLTLIIPAAGVASLKITDAGNLTAPDYSYVHPNLPGYQVVVKRWTAANAQVKVESNYAFVGTTYGLGSVESYGYNIGAQFDSTNLLQLPYNTVKGFAFYDNNGNTTKEADEPYFPYANLTTIRPGKDTARYYAPFGNFVMYTDTGTYITNADTYAPYYTAVPASHTSTFTSYYNQDSISFAMQRTAKVRDLFTGFVASSPARPGFVAHYRLGYGNKGTDTADVEIKLAKSNKLTLSSSSITPASVTADTIRWNINAVKPADAGNIILQFTVATPPTVNVNDTLKFTAIIASDTPDTTAADNKYLLKQRVVGSFDPNDKMESHDGQAIASALQDGETLNYTIRFQNTGSDTAFNITIRDTLDNKLDWSTLQMKDASHIYQLTVNDGIAVWTFNNVNLVDSNRNEPLSHGHVNFSIKTKASVAAGDVIQNSASIYFDHNLPVVTNKVSTTVISQVLPVSLLSFTATKQESRNVLQWNVAQQVNFSHFELERSEDGREFHFLARIAYNGNQYTYYDRSFSATTNYYRLKMVDKDGRFEYSPVRRLNNKRGMDAGVYPNPATETIYVRVENVQSKQMQVEVMSAEGKVLQTQQMTVNNGVSVAPVNISSLSKGSYLVRLTGNQGETQVLRFTKQ